ncbi:hypothetical protein GCM10009830_23920 [Glycomyces endophyticus]|uniref:Uncharacterized protein n=1 Tax=Glycomyces endophyticus TaxID=480996 RepID=A0ABN2GT97_9ACTN
MAPPPCQRISDPRNSLNPPRVRTAETPCRTPAAPLDPGALANARFARIHVRAATTEAPRAAPPRPLSDPSGTVDPGAPRRARFLRIHIPLAPRPPSPAPCRTPQALLIRGATANARFLRIHVPPRTTPAAHRLLRSMRHPATPAAPRRPAPGDP